VHLIPIPAHEVADKWHLAEPWVRSAVEEAALVETVDSYKSRCLDRSAQLWLISDQAQVVGCGITEIYDTPKGLTCAIPVTGAASMEHIGPALEEIEAWAKSEGCVRLEEYGRIGWTKALKPYGWRPLSVVMEKDI
jgi:hypothetical protein